MGSKVIVIGAGIIGASIAYHLAKIGAEVTVLEKAQPASGATAKTFAWINSSSAENQDYYRLRCASMAAYRKLQNELDDEDFKVRWGGSLEWTSKGDEPSQLIENFREIGCPFSLIDGAEFADLEPAVKTSAAHFIHAPDEGAIDAVAATHALLRAGVARQAKLLNGCAVDEFVLNNNRICGVKTSLGEFLADTVVVAAGEWAQTLLAKANSTLPMDNNYGLIVRTKPVAPVVSRVILAPTGHFRQEFDGTIVARNTFSGGDVNEDPNIIAARLLGQLKLLLPQVADLEIDQINLCKRPVPADGFPAVGYVSAVKGLYVASMHSGITLMPIMGKLVAEEIVGGTQAALLNPYRPTRFE